MKEKPHCSSTKRHYKKIAAAIGSAVVIASAIIPSLAVGTAAPEEKAPAAPEVAQAAPPAPPTPPEPPQQAEQAKPKTPPPEETAKQVLDITATAYAPGPHDNDQWGNKTRMGTQIRPGVIAVDPRVIPLGSRVMIKYPDGTKEYAVAEDTGGAIKGHRIDVAKWTVREAYKFGIKPVKVYVLSRGTHQNNYV